MGPHNLLVEELPPCSVLTCVQTMNVEPPHLSSHLSLPLPTLVSSSLMKGPYSTLSLLNI